MDDYNFQFLDFIHPAWKNTSILWEKEVDGLN